MSIILHAMFSDILYRVVVFISMNVLWVWLCVYVCVDIDSDNGFGQQASACSNSQNDPNSLINWYFFLHQPSDIKL